MGLAGNSAAMIDSTSYFVRRLLSDLNATQFMDRYDKSGNPEQWAPVAQQIRSFLEQMEALTACNTNLLRTSRDPGWEISDWHRDFRWCLEQKSELDRAARSLSHLLGGFDNDNKLAC